MTADRVLCLTANEYVIIGSANINQRSMVCKFVMQWPGDSEFQQLLHIFRLLGTPTKEQWAGVSSLRDWHVYPRWEAQNLVRAVPSMGPDGLDLLSKMLKYDPGESQSCHGSSLLRQPGQVSVVSTDVGSL